MLLEESISMTHRVFEVGVSSEGDQPQTCLQVVCTHTGMELLWKHYKDKLKINTHFLDKSSDKNCTMMKRELYIQ